MQRSLFCSAHCYRRAGGEMSIDIIAGAQRHFAAGSVQRAAPCSIATRCRIRLCPEIMRLVGKPSAARTFTHELACGWSIVSGHTDVKSEAKGKDGHGARQANGLFTPGLAFPSGTSHERSPRVFEVMRLAFTYFPSFSEEVGCSPSTPRRMIVPGAGPERPPGAVGVCWSCPCTPPGGTRIWFGFSENRQSLVLPL